MTTRNTNQRRRLSLCANAESRKRPFCKDDVVRSLGDPSMDDSSSSSGIRSHQNFATKWYQRRRNSKQKQQEQQQQGEQQQLMQQQQHEAMIDAPPAVAAADTPLPPVYNEMQELEQHILTAGNLAVFESSKYAAIIGAYATVSLPILMYTELLRGDFWLPTLTTAIGTSICLLLRELARRNLVKGLLAYVIFAVFANVPTFLFVACHLSNAPDGAATFIFGTLTFLYPLVVLLSSFIFSKWLCVSTAAAATFGYAICGYLAMPHLTAIQGFGLTTMEDMTSSIMWMNRMVTIFTIGPTAGALATFGRRLAVLAVAEARQRDNVRRLLGEYVSEQIADRLLSLEELKMSDNSTHHGDGTNSGNGQDALVCGERTECVMLFCDIRSFTAFSESTDATEVVQRLNMWFDVAVKACSAHGGVVDKFIGDAIMVTFGGVVPLTTPSASAVGAAKDMLQACDALNDQWSKQGKPPMSCGIGLHKGPVVLGSIGSSERKDFTVIGDAVNTASRLESMCKKYDRNLLISNAIFQDLHHTEQESGGWDCLGLCPVVGRTEPVQIWSLPKKNKTNPPSPTTSPQLSVTNTETTTTAGVTATATQDSKSLPSPSTLRHEETMVSLSTVNGSTTHDSECVHNHHDQEEDDTDDDDDEQQVQKCAAKVANFYQGTTTTTKPSSFTASITDSVDSTKEMDDDETAQLAAERCVAEFRVKCQGVLLEEDNNTEHNNTTTIQPIAIDNHHDHPLAVAEATTESNSTSLQAAGEFAIERKDPPITTTRGPTNCIMHTHTNAADNNNSTTTIRRGRKRRRGVPSLQVLLSATNSERSLQDSSIVSDDTSSNHKRQHLDTTTTTTILSPR